MVGRAHRGRSRRRALCLSVLLALSAACATSGSERGAPSGLKHRVAVLAFENTTDFVTGSFEKSDGVPLGKRAQVLLMT